MAIEEFMHYGVKVKYQCLENQSFEEILKEKRIQYTALPYLRDVVFRYIIDGVKRYAYIEYGNAPDVYIENVYITTEVPEDLKWSNISLDFKTQKAGNEPMELPTRAKVIYDAAKNEVLKGTPFSFGSIALGNNPDKERMSIEVMRYCHGIKELREMDHHDCPELNDKGYDIYVE